MNTFRLTEDQKLMLDYMLGCFEKAKAGTPVAYEFRMFVLSDPEQEASQAVRELVDSIPGVFLHEK